MTRFYLYILLFIGFSTGLSAQTLTNNPCTYPAANEFQDGDCGISVSTAGFTSLLDITSCGTGATTIDDGWFWYDGTGTGNNTITFTPDPGFDAVIQVLEGADLNPCAGYYEGACADNAGAGGAETVIGGGISGIRYIVIIENVGSNATMTGTLCMTENPASCDDGIQNGTETCLDAGGSCPYGCPPPTTTSTGSCSNTINTTVDVITCDLIGTPGFTETSGYVNVSGLVKNGPGVSAPSCGFPSGNPNNLYATWVTYDPLTGVTAGSFFAENILATKDVSYVLYDGTCGSLNEHACGTMASINGVNADLDPVNFSGLDPTKTYHLLLYSTSPFQMGSMFQGFAGTPTNDNCASATVATGPGCNVGANPASFTPPGNYVACTGGGWTTNENTVYYSFTPDSVNATLEIDGIECNDGSGAYAAQFGVWTSCAAMSLLPTLANGFLGCAVGTSPLVLSGLNTSQTYYIAVDGTAGSICDWDFSGNGIILPIELIDFSAKLSENGVDIEWKTEREVNNDYFTIEKSVDGKNYEVVDVVDGAGNSNVTLRYTLIDSEPYEGISYYRLKQTDYDGTRTYSEVKVVDNSPLFDEVRVYPNPLSGNGYLSFSSPTDSEQSVIIYDVAGRVVYQDFIAVKSGNNKITLYTESLGKGMYFIKLGESELAKNIKLIKE